MPGGGGRPGIDRSFRHLPGLAIRWNRQPDTRFTKSSHPYMLPDRTKIAEDFTDLTDGSILHTINIDPTGKPIGLKLYWTGTNSDGTTAQYFQTCDGWTADPLVNFYGMAGRTDKSTTLWSTRWSSNYCNLTFRLVCFQQ